MIFFFGTANIWTMFILASIRLVVRNVASLCVRAFIDISVPVVELLARPIGTWVCLAFTATSEVRPMHILAVYKLS